MLLALSVTCLSFSFSSCAFFGVVVFFNRADRRVGSGFLDEKPLNPIFSQSSGSLLLPLILGDAPGWINFGSITREEFGKPTPKKMIPSF